MAECAGRPTYLQGPASAMLVVVTDPLELAATCEFSGDELQTSPQKFAVEKQEELGHHSGEGNKEGRGMRLMDTFYTHAAAHATVVCGNIGCLCGDFLISYV